MTSVRIVRLADVWPDMPPGGDIADMLGPDGPWSCRDDADIRAALEELADGAVEWTPGPGDASDDDEQSPALSERWRPRLFADLAAEDSPEFVIHGIAASGHTTLFSARAKCGKTTALCEMIRALRTGETFIGLPVVTGRVLLITEESFGLWKRRDEERRIGEHCRIISRPFLSRPTMGEWAAFCRYIARLVAEHSIALVIVDTLSKVSPVESENDAAQVSAAMMPLASITEAGAALLVVHHQRKGDGEAGDGVRGSGAFTASVDIIIEMRHFAATDRSDRRRTLNVVGRFDECPADELVIELGPDGRYVSLGTKQQAKGRDRLVTIENILPHDPPGLTADEIRDGWPEGERKPGKSMLFSTLQVGRDTGTIGTTGTGNRNDPLRFYRRAAP